MYILLERRDGIISKIITLSIWPLTLWSQSNREIPLNPELCGPFALWRSNGAFCLFIDGHKSPSIVKFIEITLTITLLFAVLIALAAFCLFGTWQLRLGFESLIGLPPYLPELWPYGIMKVRRVNGRILFFS